MFKYEPASANVSLNCSCVPGCLYRLCVPFLSLPACVIAMQSKSIDTGVRLRECFKYPAIIEEVFNLNILNPYFFFQNSTKSACTCRAVDLSTLPIASPEGALSSHIPIVAPPSSPPPAPPPTAAATHVSRRRPIREQPELASEQRRRTPRIPATATARSGFVWRRRRQRRRRWGVVLIKVDGISFFLPTLPLAHIFFLSRLRCFQPLRVRPSAVLHVPKRGAQTLE